MILDDIMAYKKVILAEAKKRLPAAKLMGRIAELDPPRPFYAALEHQMPGRHRIIAEVKKASPSKGVIRESFLPVDIARQYEAYGAAAVSVLTEDRFFMGSLEYLRQIRSAVSLPVLRKDFLFDPYQVYETREAGADALLLIAAVLEKEQLRDLISLAGEIGLSALVEVHTGDELEKSLVAGATVIGINNRDLQTFKTDIKTTLALIQSVPDDIIAVSESGLNTREDIASLRRSGIDAFLIGEALMRAPSPGLKLKDFL